MTEDPKAVQLLGEVLEKTRDSRLRWEPTAMEERFTAALGGKFSLVLDKIEDAITLDLYDQKGRRLITVHPQLRESGVPSWLSELHELARRGALNADAAVDSVLEDLRKL
jgi:hypothetical protein